MHEIHINTVSPARSDHIPMILEVLTICGNEECTNTLLEMASKRRAEDEKSSQRRKKKAIVSLIKAAKCVTEGTQGVRLVTGDDQRIVLTTGNGDKDLRTLSEQERLHGERIRREELAKLSNVNNALERTLWRKDEETGEKIDTKFTENTHYVTEILEAHVDTTQKEDDVRDRTLTVAGGATYLYQSIPFQLNPHRDVVYLNVILQKNCTTEFCQSVHVKTIRKRLKDTCCRGTACHFKTLFPYINDINAGPVAIESVGAAFLTTGVHTVATTVEVVENALKILATFWGLTYTAPTTMADGLQQQQQHPPKNQKLEAGDPEVGAVTRRNRLCLPCILAAEEMNLVMSMGTLPYSNVEGTVGWCVDPVDTNVLHQTAVVGYVTAKEEGREAKMERTDEGEETQSVQESDTMIPRTNFLSSEIHIDDGAKMHGHGRFAHLAAAYTIRKDAGGCYNVTEVNSTSG